MWFLKNSSLSGPPDYKLRNGKIGSAHHSISQHLTQMPGTLYVFKNERQINT